MKTMSIDGTWESVTKSPMGNQVAAFTFASDGANLTGTMHADEGDIAIYDGHIDGADVEWWANVTRPMKFSVHFKGVLDGDTITGKASPKGFPGAPFTATRETS